MYSNGPLPLQWCYMKITDGRINYLSREIAKAYLDNGVVKDIDLNALAREVKRGIVFFLRNEEAIDLKVREKIGSLKKSVPEGSAEWDILYRQYYNEEVKKL